MKAKKRSRREEQNWSVADHVANETRKQASRTEKQERRRAVLTHETREKKDQMKLKLHIKKTERELEQLKYKLENWDPVEEAELERQARELAENPPPPKKKGRAGPETWKLRGAARPAHEIYDFDVRYVDPHTEAHRKAHEKASRKQNLLAIYKGRLANDAPEIARDYLGLLMQLGHLRQEANQFKAARETFLQCVDLEGENPITTARESLMRMYLELKRYDAAFRLGERFKEDSSVWIKYSMALLSIQQKNDEAEKYIVQAIRTNPLTAFYLAFYDTFSDVMEFTEDIEAADDEPQSSLEEAIEYCISDQIKVWQALNGDLILRDLLIRGLNGSHKELSPDQVDWQNLLDRLEREFPVKDDDDKSPNLRMYIGMYRTAMEMLEDSGQLSGLSK